MQELLNQKTLAQYLGVTARTIRRWNEEGIGPSRVRLDERHKRFYYRLEIVKNWLESLTDEGLRSLALGVETRVPCQPSPTTQNPHLESFF